MIEDLRTRAVNSVFSMSTFSTSWGTWRGAIAELTDNLTDAGKVYDLGDHLSDVFKMTGDSGRDQGSLSGGGAAWEGLVCWYLNLVMTGSRAVVLKQSKNLIPKTLSDAMTVTYKNVPTNTESDLSGIVFPENFVSIGNIYDRESLNSFIDENLSNISLHNIQCKTNWNDNAQVPMLWDMIYQFRGIKRHSVRIGVSGVDLDDLADFTYSFVTVPTQSRPIKPNSMAVRRVESLSGGNYWGRPSQAGVAESLSEIFKRVFKSAFDGGIRGHIDNQIRNGAISLPAA